MLQPRGAGIADAVIGPELMKRQTLSPVRGEMSRSRGH